MCKVDDKALLGHLKTESDSLYKEMAAIKEKIKDNNKAISEIYKRDMMTLHGTCFFRDLPNFVTEYICCVPGMIPELARGTYFNSCQVPAYHFYYNPFEVVPFEAPNGENNEAVFWCEDVFRGALPAEYHGMPRPMPVDIEKQFKPCSKTHFCDMAKRRLTQFLSKISDE